MPCLPTETPFPATWLWLPHMEPGLLPTPGRQPEPGVAAGASPSLLMKGKQLIHVNPGITQQSGYAKRT